MGRCLVFLFCDRSYTELLQTFTLHYARTWLTICPIIITTSRNTQNLAHLYDTKFMSVFIDKLVYDFQSLAKMCIAFFKILFSSSKSLNRFSKTASVCFFDARLPLLTKPFHRLYGIYSAILLRFEQEYLDFQKLLRHVSLILLIKLLPF